jgi:hypothetical protein
VLDRLRRLRFRRGDRYDGPACYCTDYSLVPRPGFYALDATGKRVNPHVRLVYVDDAPGDPNDGSGHYEIAGRKDPEQRPGERVVELAVAVKGSAELTPSVRRDALTDPEATLAWLESDECVLSDDAKAIVRELAEDALR